MLKRTHAVWLGLALVGAIGCDSTGSPSDPGGTPRLVVEGQMLPDEVLSEPVPLGDGDTVRVRVDDFVVVEGEAPAFDLILGVGIGRVNSTSGECNSTSSRLLSIGGEWVIHLESDNYCVSVFDPGVLLAESVATYRVLIFDAF